MLRVCVTIEGTDRVHVLEDAHWSQKANCYQNYEATPASYQLAVTVWPYVGNACRSKLANLAENRSSIAVQRDLQGYLCQELQGSLQGQLLQLAIIVLCIESGTSRFYAPET